jgi:hypothetical protein
MLRKIQRKHLFIVIIAALALNAISFLVAYPEITELEFETLARDFSAYYMGTWRLYNNPTQVYYDGSLPNDYLIVGTPQPFKYTPSFLLLMTPFLGLNFMDALVLFNFLQFALMPLLAFFVYKLVKDRSFAVAAITAVIVLVSPIPTPASNIPTLSPLACSACLILISSAFPPATTAATPTLTHMYSRPFS